MWVATVSDYCVTLLAVFFQKKKMIHEKCHGSIQRYEFKHAMICYKL